VAVTPETVFLRSERDRELWRAYAKLPERCQRLLRLVATSASYEEVAAALDMPIGSIGPTRARCLERLKRSLLASGINADVGDS
jgi:DNA-directed RNA polymerase specialized sigma24 family protein